MHLPSLNQRKEGKGRGREGGEVARSLKPNAQNNLPSRDKAIDSHGTDWILQVKNKNICQHNLKKYMFMICLHKEHTVIFRWQGASVPLIS